MIIKKIINFRTKFYTRLILQTKKPLDYFAQTEVPKNKKCVFFFLAADYGNLGDVAITYAQTKFIYNYICDVEVIEIPISKTLEGFWFVKRNIKKGDIVTTVGGGNLGELYDQIEYIRQLVVRFFPNNKIISFPQTFDFSSTKNGLKALKIAKKVYNSHTNLHFFAREQTSFKLMKTHFNKAKVYLTPDIVLSLNKQNPTQTRNGVVICMRKDKEKNISVKQTETLIRIVNNRFENQLYYDTHIGKNGMDITERVEELGKIWDAFRNAELVVTDRLHGMIFCYITNTPCLVFLNNNHKVNGTHKWIDHANHIKLMNKFDESLIKSSIEDLKNTTCIYRRIEKKYQALIDCLQND